MSVFLSWIGAAPLLFVAAIAAIHSAAADETGNFLGLDLKASLGEGRHSRYVPPMTNPVFNDTPYITAEARSFYFRHEIPGDFVTEGGSVDFIALQRRLALTERLGFIAAKDRDTTVTVGGGVRYRARERSSRPRSTSSGPSSVRPFRASSPARPS
jgi:hypothetical protein